MVGSITAGEDDRGVSPVIGVILMVAITVILAAVIASFVLGLGDQTDDVAPNVNFEGEFNDSNGFTLSVETTDGEGDASDFVLTTDTGEDVNLDNAGLNLSAGSSVGFANKTDGELDENEYNATEVSELEVVFRGDTEQVFDTFEVPDN